MLLEKLKDMNDLNQTLSNIRHCNTGVAQGCVLSPTLFTLYTIDCRKVHPNNFIFKFADDTTVVSLLHKDVDTFVYHDEINTFVKWCDKNHPVLNVTKTQEMVLDPEPVTTHKPVVIKDQTVN